MKREDYHMGSLLTTFEVSVIFNAAGGVVEIGSSLKLQKQTLTKLSLSKSLIQTV